LGLSESVSYASIAVARAAVEIPVLNFAIQKQMPQLLKPSVPLGKTNPQN
jgi:hypothetical protein